jgi:hypothetical protein
MANTREFIDMGTANQRSVGQLFGDVVRDIQNIMRAEIRLARTEFSEKAKRAGKASGMLGIAGVTGGLAAACFVTACIAALALVMAVWLSALVVGIVLGLVAAGSFVTGRNRLRRVDPVPQRTIETLKDDIEWAKHRTQ